MARMYTIGEASETLGMPASTIRFYDVAAAAGTCDVPREMPPEEMPEEMRRIKERCGISRY